MYALTDEALREIVATTVSVEGRFYKADPNLKTFAVGDLVLDRKDGSYATVDLIKNERAVLRDGSVVEVNVSLDRLVKLVPFSKKETINAYTKD